MGDGSTVGRVGTTNPSEATVLFYKSSILGEMVLIPIASQSSYRDWNVATLTLYS